MFDKLLGKKKREGEVLKAPQKKFSNDPKTVSKLSSSGLKDLVADQEKYITTLLEIIESGRGSYERLQEKYDELAEKNEVVQSQILKMTNEHEQLTIKFDNLQLSLQEFSRQEEERLREQLAFIAEHQLTRDKFTHLNAILSYYCEEVLLCVKIQAQNRALKDKYSQLEQRCQGLEERLKTLNSQASKLDNECQQSKLVEFITAETSSSQETKEFKAQQLKNQSLQGNVKLQVKVQAAKSQVQNDDSESQEKTSPTVNDNTVQTRNKSEYSKTQQLLSEPILNKDTQQLKTKLSISLKQISEVQITLKKAIVERDALKQANLHIIEEKQALQALQQQHLLQANHINSELKKQTEKNKRELQEMASEIANLVQKCKNYQAMLRNYALETQNAKGDNKKMATVIQERQRQKHHMSNTIGMLTQQMEAANEDSKSKARKYECELNQQRIKNQSFARKVQNLESRLEQNKTSMDGMYEQLVIKDKKISRMQLKLKEYKQMIQLQRKQKEEIQTNYEAKLKGLESNSILEEPTEDTTVDDNKKEEQHNADDGETTRLKNEIMLMKENNQIMKQENLKLRKQIALLEQRLIQQVKTIKGLQEKRDQVIKEIEKMSFKRFSPYTTPTSQHDVNDPKENKTERQKKIAHKASKGFEILGKLHAQLYKNFVTVFTGQLSREEVKNIECEINMLINKSSDMKDIFEDYL